jgi:hypothetical protein|tara:strand:- start:9 stop:284 length:276 start_codon:yes stop_codon:yes gene_type:complete
MKAFNKFIEEAAKKRCPSGKYWCFSDKKCKKIPMGYHIGYGGYLERDKGDSSDNKNGNGNGNGSSNGGGNGSGNGSGNGGGNGSGGGGGGE